MYMLQNNGKRAWVRVIITILYADDDDDDGVLSALKYCTFLAVYM